MTDIKIRTDRSYPPKLIDREAEHAMIAVCAYFKAEKRNFKPGFELEDWLEAEREILNQGFYWRIG